MKQGVLAHMLNFTENSPARLAPEFRAEMLKKMPPDFVVAFVSVRTKETVVVPASVSFEQTPPLQNIFRQFLSRERSGFLALVRRRTFPSYRSRTEEREATFATNRIVQGYHIVAGDVNPFILIR